MIPFFPQIYPDELWYSAITRFHKYSGLQFWSDSLELLLPDIKNKSKIGSLLPNETMQNIAERLPDKILELEDLALNHSLFAFRLRFLNNDRKKLYLEEFINGKDIQPRILTITKKLKEHSLRYCPVCVKIDTQKYGEAYLHTEHQIWIMPLCPFHRCKLIGIEKKNSMPIGKQLICIPTQIEDADMYATETDMKLTETIHKLYTMPLLNEPSLKSENLSRAIENAGLMMEGNVNRLSWDCVRVYNKLCNTFGNEMVEEIFGKSITAAHVRRLRKFEIAYTEEYILLCVMLNLDINKLFVDEKIPLKIETEMLRLSKSGIPCNKNKVAKTLGIRVEQVMPYAKRFGIAPFWIQSGLKKSTEDKKQYPVIVYLTENECKALEKTMADNNIQAYGHLLKYILKQYIDSLE